VTLPAEFDAVLREGVARLGVAVDGEALARLRRYAEALLRWNARMNLTSVVTPAEVAEIHLVDSLALLRTLESPRTLLDIGSGAGLPGVVLACARPALRVTCCDSVQKKVTFVKAIAAELALPVTARAVRAGGDPEAEGLDRAEAVVSRALADPDRWLPLGARYLAPTGKLFAMLGRAADERDLVRAGAESGLALEVLDRFTLHRSGAERAIARFAVRSGA
jgi:16S rRNA (guanine527-N7)-methyltransferase